MMKIKGGVDSPIGYLNVTADGKLMPEVVCIKREESNAKLPTRGSAGAAGWDLYANASDPARVITINPHTSHLVSTGVAAAIPEGCVGLLFARSGLAARQHLRPSNCVGVIDSDYRGIIKVSLHNDSDEPQMINDGDRIAQLVIVPFLPIDFKEVFELDETDRGKGGFGSTGR